MLLTVEDEVVDPVSELVDEVVLTETVEETVPTDEVVDDPGGVDACPVEQSDDGGSWKGRHVAAKSLAALKPSVSAEESLPLMTSILDA